MATIVAAKIQALDGDAPAPAATWTSPVLSLFRETAFGPAALGTLLNFYLYHQAQAWAYFIQISHTTTPADFRTIRTDTGAGHAVTPAEGTFFQQPLPAVEYARILVTNTGAGPATSFRVFASAGVL